MSKLDNWLLVVVPKPFLEDAPEYETRYKNNFSGAAGILCRLQAYTAVGLLQRYSNSVVVTLPWGSPKTSFPSLIPPNANLLQNGMR